MKNGFLISAFILTAAFLLPSTAFAGEQAYATEMISANYRVYAPDAALGAPDGFYTSFLKRDASITLGFGGAIASGDVTLTYQLSQFGAGFTIDLMDKDMNVLVRGEQNLPTGQSEIVFPYEGTYSYIRLGSVGDEKWSVDAVTVEKKESPSVTVQTPATPSTSSVPTIPQGLLVKLPDDGNPATTEDSAVYVIGGDGMRHAFPSLSVFSTWFSSFDDVALIDADHLASYPLGKNVTVRPGTALVKLTTDPKVYAVEPGGKLRWVASEEIAKTLFGNARTKRVIDVSDVFFGNYTIGEPIYTTVHPDGSVGVLSTGEVVYLKNGLVFSLPNHTGDLLHMDDAYYVPMMGEVAKLYVNGGDLVLTPEIQFPY